MHKECMRRTMTINSPHLNLGHPCFSTSGHGKTGRIHLAVAPVCNISCNYCVRKFDCANESRPGVTSRVQSSKEALQTVMKAKASNIGSKLTVVGIAGPGEPLANLATFETLRGVKRDFPEMILCLSTNGLLLPEKIDELVEIGVSHVTVTLNTLDEKIGAKIYSYVRWEGKTLIGPDAARVLINNQLEGIELASKAGMTVKVNTVLIPSINDQLLYSLGVEIKKRGAHLHNIMPLIPQGKLAHIVAISIPTSDQQIKNKLKKDRAWVLDQMGQCILNAKKEVGYIVLGLEDASRADFSFLAEILAEAEKLGVDRVRFADTTGILEPLKVFFTLQELVGVSNIPLEFHAHNDLGMATANALAAVQAGFKAISVTVGGIGERAGNAALEEVAVALKYSLNQTVRLDLKRLNSLCLTVSMATDRKIPRAKPIIGEDIFTHTSSIHIDGMQKDFANYQSYPPESLGRRHTTSFGKYSGRKTILRLLKAKGIELNQETVEEILLKILRQTNHLKRPLEEEDILELIVSAC